MRDVFSLSTLPLLVLLVYTSLTPSLGKKDLIEETCRNSSRGDPNINYQFCVASLRPAPGSDCATLEELGMISMRLVQDNATATRCHIKRLLRRKKWDARTRLCLEECLELYSDSISSLQEATRQLSSRNFDVANIEVSAAMDGFTTCEDSFTEMKGEASPLTKRNNDAFHLSAMVLSLMRMEQDDSLTH